jgi:hypothetical protein
VRRTSRSGRRHGRGGDGADWPRARLSGGAGERPGGRRFHRSGHRGFSPSGSESTASVAGRGWVAALLSWRRGRAAFERRSRPRIYLPGPGGTKQLGWVGANPTERGGSVAGATERTGPAHVFRAGPGSDPGDGDSTGAGGVGSVASGNDSTASTAGRGGAAACFRGGAAERLFGGNSGGSVFRGTSGGLFLFPPTKGRKRNWAGRLGIAPNRSKRHGRTGQPGEELRDWLNAGDEGKGTGVEAGRTSGRGLAPARGGPVP